MVSGSQRPPLHNGSNAYPEGPTVGSCGYHMTEAYGWLLALGKRRQGCQGGLLVPVLSLRITSYNKGAVFRYINPFALADFTAELPRRHSCSEHDSRMGGNSQPLQKQKPSRVYSVIKPPTFETATPGEEQVKFLVAVCPAGGSCTRSSYSKDHSKPDRNSG
jgi:hypothetical protein